MGRKKYYVLAQISQCRGSEQSIEKLLTQRDCRIRSFTSLLRGDTQPRVLAVRVADARWGETIEPPVWSTINAHYNTALN
jgi:hypothetical protein